MALRKSEPVFINLDKGKRIETGLPAKLKGTYVLIGWLEKDKAITVGKLGKFNFESGYYAYTGSAFGPGGLSARVSRHLKKNKSSRWHIDYLRKHLEVKAVWFSLESNRQECGFAQRLSDNCQMKGVVRKFGSSDCNCTAHLVHSPVMPKLDHFLGVSSCVE